MNKLSNSEIEYHIMDMPEPGWEGVDEIAELLGVKPDGAGSLFVGGKSGDSYSLTELIEAHIVLMLKTLKGGANVS